MVENLIGQPFPLGCHLMTYQGKKGVNFAVSSHTASDVELVIFCNQQEIRLPMHHTDHIWHLFVVDLAVGTQYGFRVQGEQNEQQGKLFNPQKLLVDPYAYAIAGMPNLSCDNKRQSFMWNDPSDNAEFAPKSIVVDRYFDWEDDQYPLIPWSQTIIYEAHVKGFSRINPAIPTEIAGTFSGLSHPTSIAHLKRLGITAVELLPITYHIDEAHLQKMGRVNYWGYNVLGHFAVDPTLAADKHNPLNEFKQMVKALHKAGIEVIMDVVFNHTAEAGKDGPTLSQRGIDNLSYYYQTENGDYLNWSGCGNSLKISEQQSTLRWVIDCLRYWATECHIDGFRFDLATILGREPDFSAKSAFFTALASYSELARVKWIAEPWDIGWGGYQLGAFPPSFAEWNDRYRDGIRQFILAQSGNLADFARRFSGSDDLFALQRLPANSINFITAHDGFNLRDLVSYNEKHNWANGENNQDGHQHNISNNHGVEGETDNAEIVYLRTLTRKALLAILLLSGGTPMLLSGDELGHTQQGNNNCYCQDNEITWLNWLDADQNLIDYTASLIALRKQIPLLSQRNQWWTAQDVQWLAPNGCPLCLEDWQNKNIKAIQILLQDNWLIVLNAKQSTQQFLLPKGQWKMLLGQEKANLMTDTLAVTLDHIEVCVLQRN